MKKTMSTIIFAIALFWGLLTLFVEAPSSEKTTLFGERMARKNALIVYDADPFYSLDEQVCNGFAEGLAQELWLVKVTTVAAAKEIKGEFDLYVFCTNTYNWAPDWAVSSFIKNHKDLKHKKVVAITVGAGTTNRAQRLLEQQISQKKANLLDSKSFWLMRPNDESKLDVSNITVAVEMAKDWGSKIGQNLDKNLSVF